ncbi:MAG: acyl-CoA dehydrogenase family protein [Spirulinaceae cyanobacterium]
MHPLKRYWVAETLEKDLGAPTNPNSKVSWQRTAELDEKEEFPQAEVDWLYNWKLQHYYIPSEYGGEFTNFEEFVAFVRVLSRRDQNVAIAFTTMFWSYLCWMAGTPEQKKKLASLMKDENETMCLAYSEKEHGSDLVGGETTATKVPGGYLLNGEKWPINRATRSGTTFVIAQTDPEGGSRSLSLFMVDKRELDKSQYYNLPKIPCHGIKAADMSGIGFTDCFIPESTLLGEEGQGLELGLKGFQITRTLCAAFSQGAADTTVRTTLKLALNRIVYGKTVFDLPLPRRILVNAFLDILICDCEVIASARGFSVVPQQFSVWASVVKYFVPITLENMINGLSSVLGARFYFRDEHDSGVFQKMLRDNSIISIFDGSGLVNLHALILQFRQVAKQRSRLNEKKKKALASRLETIFTLNQEVPPFDGSKLEIFGRGADDPMQGLELSLAKLEKWQNNPDVDQQVLKYLLQLTSKVGAEVNDMHETFANSSFEFGHDQTPESFELAKKYCALHAASCCIHMWVYNRTNLEVFFAQGEWLVLALNKLLKPYHPNEELILPDYAENLAQELVKLYNQDKLFSIVPFQLAQTQSQENKKDASSELQLQA